jgi:hypothetical protein
MEFNGNSLSFFMEETYIKQARTTYPIQPLPIDDSLPVSFIPMARLDIDTMYQESKFWHSSMHCHKKLLVGSCGISSVRV